ncbi:PaaI family thioesterase [Sporomusa sp. KB1]|jgi:acyl-CoA thioesterase|uniref:PaaI family thioesterase n=1 Tax=Sporomusa sp. KB1 TaxID=943346 RepID=UPI0011A9D18A|nr:PaaI family thioesterase [Sporomusa sp. KB1]TWH45718.1 acyl-CoA thioesterase [Sporomusa sp. KB1]
MEKVKQFFSTNDQFAKHVGLELLEAEKGYARVKMVIQPHHLNGVQTVHGGAIFTLADFTLAIASNSHGRIAMGVNATISYMKAVSTGILFAEAREVSLNHKLGHYLVNIYDEQHEPIASFQGMVYRKEAQLTFEG